MSAFMLATTDANNKINGFYNLASPGVALGAQQIGDADLAAADSLPSGLVFNGFKETRRMIAQNYSYGAYRTNSYGNASHYGYGTYGAYGEDDADEEKEIAARKKKRKQVS
jgi:hypothetical protein